MSGRQKLGELIRSINYEKVKGDPEDPLHPTSKLKYLKENCNDLTFDELKDGFKAFEEKICVKKFPHADQPGFDVAETTIDVLLELTRGFVKSNKGKEKVLAEVQFNTMAALIRAGPNSSHVGLMWNFTDHAVSLDLFFKGLKKKELLDVLEKLYFPIDYKENKACDKKVYYASVCARMEQIYKHISKDQFRMVQREFIRYYNLYNNQIQITYNDDIAKPIYELMEMLMKKIGNPFLILKRDDHGDVSALSTSFNMLGNLFNSVGYANTQPTIDAARLLMDNLLEYMLKNNLLVDYFGAFMVNVSQLFNNDQAAYSKENIMYDIREVLLRNIAEKNIPVKPLFTGFMELVNKILSRDKVSHESHLVIEDVLTIIVKRSKGLSDDDVKQVLIAVKGIVLSGHRDLVRKLDPVFESLKKDKCLDWKKHTDEALDIINAFGDVTPEHLKRDYDRVFTIAVYCLFLRKFLNMLKQSGVLPLVQTNLVVSVFKNLQDTTLIKIQIAETGAHPDFLDFSKDKGLRLLVLKTSVTLLKNTELPWDDNSLIGAVSEIINGVATAFKGNGRNVSVEENDLFMTIFNKAGNGGESATKHWYQKDNEGTPNINLEIWKGALKSYVELHQKSATLACIAAVMPNIIRWANIAVDEEHDEMIELAASLLSTVGQAPPKSFSKHLQYLFELLLKSEKCQGLHDFVKHMYPDNPGAVHDNLLKLFDSLDRFEGTDMAGIYLIVVLVSERHPEVFTKPHIKRMFDRIRTGNQYEKAEMLKAMDNISEKHASVLAGFFPQLCDEELFDESSMDPRSNIIARIGGENKDLGQKSVDYLMKHALSSSPATVRIVITSLHSMLKTSEGNIVKYKPDLQKLEKTSKDAKVKDMVHEMILVLEGKTFENVVGEVQQQKEDIGKLDTKVDATVDTVITIGGKVIEHDKEIGELGEGLERVEERVEEVDEGLGETKVKVEEIDKKTMTNAPKWSRDLTKIMNPATEKDWRLLASRLGYSKADIRAWAQQHDPCMAMLSEWYATHKTSEANYGVLTALTEMNRTDGMAIVENAMKATEGVVEDEDFEYKHPPPVFISYQWGIQNEVKLLKQHLNMAGYECWMDVGQMGGGDKLFAKIDNGIRGAKIVICCVTEKYAESPNCNREVNLSVNLNKPIIPLLMEKTDWPPKGSMGPIFSEYLFIRFFQRGDEATEAKDKRYWPVPKFQELLMQLNYFVVPDQKMVQKEYKNWWIPIVEDIEIDKNKKKQASSKPQQQSKPQSMSPVVFLSYQWGKQPQVKALYKRLTSLGYTVWMDIYQMGGGDSLYDKIDKGMRGCKAVVSCITEKYSISANCRREVSLADALKKPIIPLLLERMKWPPSGPMSLVFTEMLFINFYRNEEVQMTWKGDNFDELKDQLDQHINEQHTAIDNSDNKGVEHGANKSKADNHTKTAKQERNVNKSGANNENERTSASRKTDSLKRQDAVEERAEIDRQNKTSEGPKSQKSQACNIL